MTWTPIDLPVRTPEEAVDAWAPDRPLAALCSGASMDPHSRWSLLTEPSQVLAYMGDTEVFWTDMQCRTGSSSTESHPGTPPFEAGWIVALGYDSGFEIEPRAKGQRSFAPGVSNDLPLLAAARVERAVAHDRETGRWWSLGEWLPPLAGVGRPQTARFGIGPLASTTGHVRYMSMVNRARELIRAGDVYQVNLAHTLVAPFTGSTRSLFRALLATARPWHGAYLEFQTKSGAPVSIASASPELFLEYDPQTRRAATRPMKGTRVVGRQDVHEAHRDLNASAKDRAELAMIIDLMRNDLGRSCVLGSVRVEDSRRIERHTAGDGRGLLQSTGAVSGVLRSDRSPHELLKGAFPPGSVTGAPKIRAMQIIDELEHERRGFYCGCMGFVGDDGRMSLNVAIRTATVSNGLVTYPVGAGIVADSDPESEWRETIAKAWPIIALSEGFDESEHIE